MKRLVAVYRYIHITIPCRTIQIQLEVRSIKRNCTYTRACIRTFPFQNICRFYTTRRWTKINFGDKSIKNVKNENFEKIALSANSIPELL